MLEGQWDVTPAIHIHTELHRRRPDARVVVHNHPYWATVLASIGELPRFVHQTSCMYDGDLVFVDEYGGEIDDPELGTELAERIGDASIALLANHGVIVTGPTVEDAVYRAASLDRQCRLTYDLLLLDKKFKRDSPRRATGDETVVDGTRGRRLLGRCGTRVAPGRARDAATDEEELRWLTSRSW